MTVPPRRIPVAGPSITDREVELVAEAARTGWYENHYAFNRRFEETFAAYIGVRHAVSLPHCTAGIHLVLAAWNIGPGDEVIVPNVTWIASVAPVVHLGATPILVDMLPDTWCLDPDKVEEAVTPRTKAIIGVDLYGSMCDWARLREIADRHGLKLLEDSAEALGSEYGGRKAGALGDAGVFSFHGSKTVATGEGGMFVTDDPDLHARVLFLRDHGRTPGDRFFLNHEVAFKYRMNAVTAALGLAQMERIESLIAYKRQLFGWYAERLGDLNDVALNVEPPGTLNSYWMVTAVPDPSLGLDKFDLMKGLEERGVDSRPFFTPLSELPAFAGREDCARMLKGKRLASDGVASAINLPSGYNLDEAIVDLVCTAFRDVMDERRQTAAI